MFFLCPLTAAPAETDHHLRESVSSHNESEGGNRERRPVSSESAASPGSALPWSSRRGGRPGRPHLPRLPSRARTCLPLGHGCPPLQMRASLHPSPCVRAREPSRSERHPQGRKRLFGRFSSENQSRGRDNENAGSKQSPRPKPALIR